jgi:hypothetical protein
MSIRQRTTKLIARRHDLNYFKHGSPLRLWQWWLAAAAIIAAAVWFSASFFVHGNSAFSAGPMSSSHAAIGQRCEVCHVPVVQSTSWSPSFGMRRKVPDTACLACHKVSPHHPAESASTPSCSSCHTEHTGAMHLAFAPDSGCTQCHAQLTSRSGSLQVAAKITNFAMDHPEFRALRTSSSNVRSAAFALRFNHSGHMQPNLRTPHGLQTLQCSTCHQPALNADGRASRNFAAVSFERSCRTCHTLQFDQHIEAEAPHTDPAKVRAFVEQSIAEFAQAHPQVVADEIRHWPTEASLPGKVILPPPHTQQEWIANRVRRSEIILWRAKCSLCHRDENPESQATLQPATLALPQIEPMKQPSRWFSSAVFSHPAHQSVTCAECHANALTSSSGSDLLMPSIATCKRCHDGQSSPQGPPLKSGHAESGCALCHFYHGPDVTIASVTNPFTSSP